VAGRGFAYVSERGSDTAPMTAKQHVLLNFCFFPLLSI
jgi:hypothetical protein